MVTHPKAHFDDPVNRDRQIEMFGNPEAEMVAMGARVRNQAEKLSDLTE